jgi:hypothetical protein
MVIGTILTKDMGLFSSGTNGGGDILKQSDEALVGFEQQIAKLNTEKDSLMRRQVEVWSVSTADSNQGMETEYRDAAVGVALNVSKIMCLEAHIKKLRLAQYHAKNGDGKSLEEVMSIGDPCANIQAEIPNVIYRPAPSPVLDYGIRPKQPDPVPAAPAATPSTS